MKYLLLLLFTFNVHAQFKVEAQNSKYGRSYGATFDTELEAQAWASEQVNDDSWGKQDRWLKEEKAGYTNTREVTPDEGVAYTEYFYPKEYSYSILDITTDVQAQKSVQDRINKGVLKREKCKNALSYIAGANEDSGLSEAQVDAMEVGFAQIHDALIKSRSKKALRLINEVTDPAYADLKSKLIKILE